MSDDAFNRSYLALECTQPDESSSNLHKLGEFNLVTMYVHVYVLT
jgi:hypothetical protein